MKATRPAVLIISLAALIGGCRRSAELDYVASTQVQKLSPELQTQLRLALDEYCGTMRAPRLLGNDRVGASHLQLGAAIYRSRCEQCHGATGDGHGPQAQFMYPRPRDYRKGVFKFTSTPYGSKPRRDDLLQTIDRGVPGTSMPSFRLLTKSDREAVVDYVLVLTHRGELEESLAYEADLEEKIEIEQVESLANEIKERWHEAEFAAVTPLTPQPEFTAEHIRGGKAAFLSQGCSKCHGDDGRGHTAENIGTDAWGFPTRAADLTSGMLHGGPQPLDIYRRVISGINGTPMPGFRSALEQQPETIWNLVAYVLYVSGRRRAGEIPEAGLLKPYLATAAPQAEPAGGGGGP